MKNNKAIFLSLCFIIILGIFGYLAFAQYRSTPEETTLVYATRESCEQETGKRCAFRMCDYVPPGKTYNEVCGKNFKAGWLPVANTNSDEEPVDLEPTTTQEENGEPVIPPTGWQFIDAQKFTLSLPQNWQFNRLQGIDSYVGEFVGDNARLFFDYGRFSGSPVEDDDPVYTVTWETIASQKAKIITPKITGSGVTGIYFPDLNDGQKTMLTISGRDLSSTQQETTLQIFRTLRFK